MWNRLICVRMVILGDKKGNKKEIVNVVKFLL